MLVTAALRAWFYTQPQRPRALVTHMTNALCDTMRRRPFRAAAPCAQAPLTLKRVCGVLCLGCAGKNLRGQCLGTARGRVGRAAPCVWVCWAVCVLMAS